MERISKNTVLIDNTKVTVSTVKFDNGHYETIVMLADGDELECYTTLSESEALTKHNSIIDKFNNKNNSYVLAGDLKTGSQLAESDGYLFDVEVIKQTAKTITVRLFSDFSMIKTLWNVKPDGTKGGCIKTFRKTSKLYGII